jgi:hypothetical protein
MALSRGERPGRSDRPQAPERAQPHRGGNPAAAVYVVLYRTTCSTVPETVQAPCFQS